MHSPSTVFISKAKGTTGTIGRHLKQVRTFGQDRRQDKEGGGDGERWGEMDEVYFREQGE